VGSPDDHLEHNAVAGRVPVYDLDYEIGQGPQEVGVIRAYACAVGAVVAPRLVVEPSISPERRHDRLEIVPVLAANVLVHQRHAGLDLFRVNE